MSISGTDQSAEATGKVQDLQERQKVPVPANIRCHQNTAILLGYHRNFPGASVPVTVNARARCGMHGYCWSNLEDTGDLGVRPS
jgi:hypothetical protein